MSEPVEHQILDRVEQIRTIPGTLLEAAHHFAEQESARDELSDLDHQVLALAANPPTAPGAMLNRIRELDLGAVTDYETAYHRRLNALLDTEAALAAYPVTVNRLRRLRQTLGRRRLGMGG